MRLHVAYSVAMAAMAFSAFGQPAPTGETPATTAGIPLAESTYVLVGGAVSSDSNIFRDSGQLVPVESETISSAYVGLRLDKPYAQQRFLVDATVTAYRYSSFDYLNFDGLNYLAAWYWHVTPRVNGTLSASRNQAPTQFQYTLGRQSNVTTYEDYVFNLVGNVTGGWNVLLGASRSDRSSELSSLQSTPDYTENRVEAGIRYLFQPGTQIDAIWRRIDGEQSGQAPGGVPLASAQDYREDQSELVLRWVASAKSTLLARATYVDRVYDLAPQSDFSGTEGEIRFVWLPTSKIDVGLSATRNLEPFQGSIQSNYRVANTYSLEPVWRITATVRSYLTVQLIDERYPATTGNTFERDDTTTRAIAGMDWRAARNLTFGATLQYEERSSNVSLVEYEATIGRLSATLVF